MNRVFKSMTTGAGVEHAKGPVTNYRKNGTPYTVNFNPWDKRTLRYTQSLQYWLDLLRVVVRSGLELPSEEGSNPGRGVKVLGLSI